MGGSTPWQVRRTADRIAASPQNPHKSGARAVPHWKPTGELAHRYFDTAHGILQATVDDDLPELECAVRAMAETLPEEGDPRRQPWPLRFGSVWASRSA